MRISQDILDRFNSGFQQAERNGVIEPTAMVLATAHQSQISCRTVLLKGLDGRGFVFYTNLTSRKGLQLVHNPQAALTFLWREIQQQVLVEGKVEKVSDQEADAYFARRSRGSQIGAWASKQSQVMAKPGDLSARVAEYEKRFEGESVSRPSHWSGFRVVPDMVEFWYGQDCRLHDRFRYQWQDDGWDMVRLYP